MTRHRHHPKTERTVGYFGGVARVSASTGKPLAGSSHQEPSAAGGICIVQACACGSVRRTNCNQGWRETSGWVARGADPIDGARKVTLAEAREIVREDPSLQCGEGYVPGTEMARYHADDCTRRPESQRERFEREDARRRRGTS